MNGAVAGGIFPYRCCDLPAGVRFLQNEHQKTQSRILWYQALGFIVIIALSWMDEFVSLPNVLFGGPATTPNWHEAALETAVALAVWLPVFLVTRKLLQRLYHVERFIRVCAWCRRIGDGDKWMPMEEYFAKGFDQRTSHAICLDCAKTQLDASFRDA